MQQTFFTPGRRRNESTDRIHQYGADLFDLVQTRREATQMEQDLPTRVRDARNLQSMKDSEPKLVEKIEQLRGKAQQERRKITQVKNEQKILKGLNRDFEDFNMSQQALRSMEEEVQAVMENFAKRLGLPMEVFNPDWCNRFQQFVEDSSKENAPPIKSFETQDPECIGLLNEAHVSRHDSGGWSFEGITVLLKDLYTSQDQASKASDRLKGDLDKKNEELQQQKAQREAVERKLSEEEAKLAACRREVEGWRNRFQELDKKTKGHEDVFQQYKDLKEKDSGEEKTLEQELNKLGSDLEGIEEELNQEKNLSEERRAKISELEGRVKDLTNVESSGQELVKKNTELNEKLKEFETAAAKTHADLRQAEELCKSQVSKVEDAEKQRVGLRDVIRLLLAYAARPGEHQLDVDQLQPFLEMDKVRLDLKVDPEVYLARNQTTLARWYVDSATAPVQLSVLEIVARAVGIELSAVENMSMAIALEQAIREVKPTKTAIAAIYEVALIGGQDRGFVGAPFAVVCSVLQDLHQRFPREKAGKWWTMLREMLGTKAGTKDDIVTSTPFLEQLCIYLLSTTMGDSAAGSISKYCPAVVERARAEEIQVRGHKGLHVTELAVQLYGDRPFNGQNAVLAYEADGVHLVAIHDVRGECLFWRRREDTDWVMSTHGFDLVVTKWRLTYQYTCRPKDVVLPADAPQFSFRFEDIAVQWKKSRFQCYLEIYHKPELEKAWDVLVEQMDQMDTS